MALVPLLASTVYCYVRTPQIGRFYRDLEGLVKEQSIHRAVIFVPGIWAPISEYPFRSLADTDVVYFRLGPDERSGLPKQDPHALYDRYFRGRQAYLFDDGSLRLLERHQPAASAMPTLPTGMLSDVSRLVESSLTRRLRSRDEGR